MDVKAWSVLTHVILDQKNCQYQYLDGLVQERRNSIANAIELRLSCTNLSIWYYHMNICLHICIWLFWTLTGILGAMLPRCLSNFKGIPLSLLHTFKKYYNKKSSWILNWINRITLTLYMVFPLFASRFAAYAGGILVSFIQPRLFLFDIKCSASEIYHTDLYGWNV